MVCRKCGAIIADDSLFCFKCGTSVAEQETSSSTSQDKAMVEDFIKNSINDLNNAEADILEKEKERLLDSLGLVKHQKEYAPSGATSYGLQAYGYNESETIDGQKRYYKVISKGYPEISEDEYQQLKEIAERKKRLEGSKAIKSNKEIVEKQKELSFTARANSEYTNSFASTFMKVNAWITWIGGLICAYIMSSTTTVSGYYSSRTETVIDWKVFLSVALAFFIAGSAFMCAAELYGNLEAIKNKLSSFTIKQDNK